MPRFYLRLLPLLLLIFTLVTFLIHAQAYNDSDLRALFLQEGCAAPCFMGIKPGVTTMVDAKKMLEASGWAEHVILNSGINLTGNRSFLSVSWDWNATSSPLLDSTTPAYLLSYQQNTSAVVDAIFISTTIPMGSLRLLLQAPQRYRFGLLFPNASLTAKVLSRISAIYDKFETSANLICPMRMSRIWSLHSNLFFYSQAPANEDIRLWDNRTISRNLKAACRY